jgi:hypothetical protein
MNTAQFAGIESRFDAATLGQVDALVPRGFESLCRVFHPPSIRSRTQAEAIPTTWAKMALACGYTCHAEMTFREICDAFRKRFPVVIIEPHVGSYGTEGSGSIELRIGRLVDALDAGRGATPLNIGFNLDDGSYASYESHLPVLKLAIGRRFAVTNSAEHSIASLAPWFTGVIWPDDMSWWITSDMDLSSTIACGSESTVANVLVSNDFEAAPIKETTSTRGW